MHELVNIVYENMYKNDKKIGCIAKKMYRQERINKRNMLLMALLTAAIFVEHMEKEALAVKIKKMENEIDNLKGE